MSRIGNKPINIPKDVKIDLKDQKIIIQGKHGNLERNYNDILKIIIENNQILLTRNDNSQKSREYHGLIRALIQNMVIGVSQPYSKTLIAEGVGYKFQIEKKNLILSVGFTHPIKYNIPSDLEVKLESNTKILIGGIDKEKVGFFASQIRAVKPPEPYKGKGILYEGEKVLRKAGKTGK
jgi:large subunit ribosomal protein L6